MRTRRQEQGHPAAALAIIAAIFATALIIKLLPPVTRNAVSPVAARALPARAVSIWSESPAAVSRAALALHASTAIERPPAATAVEPPPVEIIAAVALTFAPDPGHAPVLQARVWPLVAPASAVAPAPAGLEPEPGNSLLAMPFARTGSALRFAFVRTGSAIKAAVSGTKDPRP
jgi:hypothetical protein